MPSRLHPENNIEIDTNGRPKIDVRYAENVRLKEKKQVLKDFAVNAMNKIAAPFDIQFVKHKSALENYALIPTIDMERSSWASSGLAASLTNWAPSPC